MDFARARKQVGTRARRLARGALAGAASAAALVAACSSDGPAAGPRYLDDDAARPEAAADAARDVCNPLDPSCVAPFDAGSNDGATGGDAQPDANPSCAAPNTCTGTGGEGGTGGPRDLGSVSGDVGTDQQSVQGSTSEWFTVRVTENSNGGAPLKLSVTLITPSLTNYDLYVYYDPLVDQVKCSPASASSTQQAGISDTVSLVWGEGAIPNGSLDDRTVRIEVRHVSGPCTTTDKFTLLVQGNK